MANTARKVYRIEVDKKACIGAATCVVIAPKAFEMNEDSIAEVKSTALELSDDDLLIAAQSCPTQAIILYDSEGNQIFPKNPAKLPSL
ncbi:ferredoxin [Patescibacteria group bacterium]|nr:ferredoxin [Patescibacteria group bacterium]